MNRPLTTFHYLLLLALFFFVGFMVAVFVSISSVQGPLLILGILALGFGVRGFENYQRFSYAIFIFAAISIAMFYPKYLVSVGGFELKRLIVPLLQIIMFGMGSQLSIHDFRSVVKTPKAVVVGVVCQFSIMPVIAISLTKLFDFPIEIAAGIVLVGASPSGLASNVMSFLARANVALSVTLTAIATLLAPIMTPTLMELLVGQLIPIDFWKMMLSIMDMVILPIVAGLLFNLMAYQKAMGSKVLVQIFVSLVIVLGKNAIFYGTGTAGWNQVSQLMLSNSFWFLLLPLIGGWAFKKWAGGNRGLMDRLLVLLSMIAIGVIITVITAAGRDSLLDIGLLLILACLIHNLLGYTIGYWICKFLRLDERSCRTIALEVGMQNSGLASGISVQMGKVATVGLAASVFGPMMNITGSTLAIWWRGNKNTVASADKTVEDFSTPLSK